MPSDDGPATDEIIPPRAFCVGGCGRNIVDAGDDPAEVIRWLVTTIRDGYMRMRCPSCQGL
jgi:hypothetical protein